MYVYETFTHLILDAKLVRSWDLEDAWSKRQAGRHCKSGALTWCWGH